MTQLQTMHAGCIETSRWSASVFNFFEHRYWSKTLANYGALIAWARENNAEFWSRLLSDTAASGAVGLDLGVEPADWHAAVAWAGSASNFGRRLADHGLSLSGSYQSGHGLQDLLFDDAALAGYETDISQHAVFVAESGGSVLALGAPLLRLDLPPDVASRVYNLVNRLGKITRRAGVSLAIHTEAYADWTSNTAIAQLMRSTDPELVFLCPDFGHILLNGGDPVAVLRDHASRIIAVHLKDSRHSMPEPCGLSPDAAEERMLEEFCIAGEGQVDWSAISVQLARADFRGWLVAEVDCAASPIDATTAIIKNAQSFGIGLAR